jgi:hypothetical protein
MNKYLKSLIADNYYGFPVRTDILANDLGFKIVPLKNTHNLKAFFEYKNKNTIHYNQNLTTSEIRVILALAIHLKENPFYSQKNIEISNQNIWDNSFYYHSELLEAIEIVSPKESIDIVIHQMKIYSPVEIAKNCDVPIQLIMERLKQLKLLPN